MKELTARQSQCLEFIRKTINSRGRPPTLREIGAHMGIRSTNGVNDHLYALVRKGALRRDTMVARGLRLSEEESHISGPYRLLARCHARLIRGGHEDLVTEIEGMVSPKLLALAMAGELDPAEDCYPKDLEQAFKGVIDGAA